MEKQPSSKRWKRISSAMALDEKWFRVRKDVVELPNGKIMDDYFLWLSGDVAMIVPVTANGKMILVRQYKYGADEVLVEFPAGFIDKDENPEHTVLRELEEETGYSAKELELLGEFDASPTKSNGKTFIYLARNVINDKDMNLDISEDIEVLVKSKEEVMKMVERGEIRVSDSVAAFFLAMKKIGKVNIR
ncbi:MAG: NUDIX hydrolase [uncultured bacterium]|nr:MAG: NUDIX hydrolase [uncultured bacterium]